MTELRTGTLSSKFGMKRKDTEVSKSRSRNVKNEEEKTTKEQRSIAASRYLPYRLTAGLFEGAPYRFAGDPTPATDPKGIVIRLLRTVV
jgi:hypothetical protein